MSKTKEKEFKKAIIKLECSFSKIASHIVFLLEILREEIENLKELAKKEEESHE